MTNGYMRALAHSEIRHCAVVIEEGASIYSCFVDHIVVRGPPTQGEMYGNVYLVTPSHVPGFSVAE